MAEIASVVVGVVQFVTQCLSPSAGSRISRWREFKSNVHNLKKEVERLKAESMTLQHDVDAAKRNGDEIKENVQTWLKRAVELEVEVQKWLERASKTTGDAKAAGKIRKDEETAAAPEAAAAATAAGEIREGEETTAAVVAGETGGDAGEIREDEVTAAAGEIRDDEETAAEATEGNVEAAAAQKRCFKGLCPDLKARYQLSKEAETLLKAVIKHLEAGKFDKISYPVIPKDPRLSNKDYEAFRSRTFTLKNVISSLSDPGVNIVGIYGMGGVGKTTLAKEVVNQPETNKLFDSVIFVEVTEKPDIMKIQSEIAEKLGLTLTQKESQSTRAGKLCQRLKNEKKILLILDNIWAHLDLQDTGIPLGDGRKVLLTARRLDVLEAMDSKSNFLVNLLEDHEAWFLFRKMTGDRIEGDEIMTVAIEVEKRCAHLPIVIVTVARALRNKELSAWEGAMQQMRMFSPENIQGVHSRIELSYNYLESEVLKKTFLLIRYANMTSIDELLFYGMSLGLFEGINKMKERRVRVHTLIQQLKDSCLLLNGNTPYADFSMHDVVRDVAMSIASRDRHVFTNELFDELEWPDEDALKAYPSISLKDVKKGELPQVLECQQLKLFSLSGHVLNPHSYPSLKLHDEFFTRMTELKVLVLDTVDLRSMPPSLRCLTNLRALGLYNCELDDIAIIGNFKKLEILSLRNSYIEQLPAEVGHLTRLKLLDLRVKCGLHVIPRGVISNLSLLEELYMGTFDEWEEEDGLNKDRKNVSLDELKHLSNLTCLEIQIQDAKTLPKDLFFRKLEWYNIEIGSLEDSDSYPWIWNFKWPKSSRKFKLSLINSTICLDDGHIMQLKNIEDLCLIGSQDMRNVLYGLDKHGFPQLKYLQVRDNDSLFCIVDSMEYANCNAFLVLESLLIKNLMNLEKICHGQLTTESSFGKLRKIKVEQCDKLRNMFSFSIARRLQLLQSIDISGCKNMEEIFTIKREHESNSNIGEVIDDIELSQLYSLSLSSLPQLKSLVYNGNGSETLFNGKVALPNLMYLELDKINVERIWQNEVAAISSGIQNLTRLIIRGCNNLRCLFSSSMIRSFGRLQYLEISKCQALEEILFINDDQLREEEMKKNEVVFPISYSGWKMRVEQCDKLKTLFPRNMYEKFSRLTSLYVRDCGSLEVIFDVEDTNFEDQRSAVETQLSKLNIDGLPNLKHVWNKDTPKFLFFKNLDTVSVVGCDRLKNVFPASIASNLLKLSSLEISSCGVEEIVFLSEEEAETNPRFVFPWVTSLLLYDLPNFTTFFPRTHSMEWPDIWTLELNNLKLQEFNEGQAQLLVEKVFPDLRTLRINGKSTTTIRQFPKDLFCNLDYFDVEFDGSIGILSLDFLQRFDTMKVLQIHGYNVKSRTKLANGMSVAIKNLYMCSDLKHILKEESDMDHLVHLEVSWCSNLINLVSSSTSFRNLATLIVHHCDGLTNIVTSSTAKSMGKLRQMKIAGCNMITEVVLADEGDEGKDNEIIFRELKELDLSDLKSLTSFCSTNYTLIFPSLKELIVKGCAKMKSFSGGGLSTPKLQEVKRHEKDKGCWKGDLNTTIQQLYEEMYEKRRGQEEVTDNEKDVSGSSKVRIDKSIRKMELLIDQKTLRVLRKIQANLL